MKKTLPALSALFVLALTACESNAPVPGEAPPQTSTNLSEGKQIAEQYCSSCHAIGKTDKSAHVEAVAFRDISKMYPVTDLEEALAEGLSVGHEDMPQFVFHPDEINSFLAYLDSIQTGPSAP